MQKQTQPHTSGAIAFLTALVVFAIASIGVSVADMAGANVVQININQS